MIENPLPWPKGAKCAAAFTFDIDTDSFLHLMYGEAMPDKVAATSWVRYDEIAVPRILAIFREFGIRQTFFYPAWCMERYPHLVDAILKDGHEIAHHGYLHEEMNKLPSREAELEWIGRGIEVIERMTGQKPRGFRAPTYQFSRHTASILVEFGFLYDASLMDDDVPSLYETDRGEILGLSSHWALDDWPQYVCNSDVGYNLNIRSPEEATATFIAEFEAAYRHGGMWISIWHPWVSARLARADAVRSMVETMKNRGDVWLTTMEELALHAKTEMDLNGWQPRRVKLPYYEELLPPHEVPPQNGR